MGAADQEMLLVGAADLAEGQFLRLELLVQRRDVLRAGAGMVGAAEAGAQLGDRAGKLCGVRIVAAADDRSEIGLFFGHQAFEAQHRRLKRSTADAASSRAATPVSSVGARLKATCWLRWPQDYGQAAKVDAFASR